MIETIKKLRGLLAVPMLVLGLGVGSLAVAQPAFAEGCGGVDEGITGGAECGNTGDTPQNLETDVFTQIVNILLFIIGAIAVIMLVIGGIRYTTSNGDSNQVSAAKNTILYAIIGIIVAILAYAIVNFVIRSFIGDS